jgi:hypothetical protein
MRRASVPNYLRKPDIIALRQLTVERRWQTATSRDTLVQLIAALQEAFAPAYAAEAKEGIAEV